MEENTAASTKIKIQVGLVKSVRNPPVLNFSSSSSAVAENALIFGENGIKTMAEICQSHYISKTRKLKRLRGIAFDEDDNKAGKNSKKKDGSGSMIDVTKTKRTAQDTAVPLAKTTGPRVEFVDGKMVIKESSLEIGQDGFFGDDNYAYEEIDENENQSSTKYSSFRSKSSSAAWGIEETYLFYQVLRQCGPNFSFMQTFFPGRTRDGLKNKFKREEKSHPDLIAQCVSSGLPLDLNAFSTYFGDNIVKVEVKEAKEESIEPLEDVKFESEERNNEKKEKKEKKEIIQELADDEYVEEGGYG